ncbi:MAG: hypothetical protein AAGC71_18755 [Pseudomonadota bacterium]
MFRLIRITILLYVLLCVALASYVTRSVASDWNRTLWVAVYPINGDNSAATTEFIATLSDESFDDIEAFFKREATRYGWSTREPVHIHLSHVVAAKPTSPPFDGNLLERVWWSLSMRWWSFRVTHDDGAPTPDVKAFLVLYQPDGAPQLESSVGLQKGMISVVNGYADRRARGSNNVILAHEVMHTLGASDKYDPRTNLPVFPHGFAEPERKPLLPQRRAELMGGRIPIDETTATIPRSLQSVVIGPASALEIGLSEP